MKQLKSNRANAGITGAKRVWLVTSVLMVCLLAGCGGGGGGGESDSGSGSDQPPPSGGSGSQDPPPSDESGSQDPPPVTTSSHTISWRAPTENTDGSVLTDLGGFTIYYGKQPTDLSLSIRVANPGLSIYVVEGLDSGATYYFAVAADATSGAESDLSEIVSATID